MNSRSGEVNITLADVTLFRAIRKLKAVQTLAKSKNAFGMDASMISENLTSKDASLPETNDKTHENATMNNDSDVTEIKGEKVDFQVKNKCADPNKFSQGTSVKENENIPKITKDKEHKISENEDIGADNASVTSDDIR